MSWHPRSDQYTNSWFQSKRSWSGRKCATCTYGRTKDGANTNGVFIDAVCGLLGVHVQAVLGAFNFAAFNFEVAEHKRCVVVNRQCYTAWKFPTRIRYRKALCQATWQFAPKTRLGLSVGKPFARRASCQRRFIARVARIMASEEPTVEQPKASAWGSSMGALNKRAIMLTQRFYRNAWMWAFRSFRENSSKLTQISADWGYYIVTWLLV